MQIFVARQPIFNQHREVYAYELLFRSSMENFFSAADQEQASSQMIDQSLHGFGLDLLTGSKKAFINATRGVLLENFFRLLPREKAVVEVLETVEPDSSVVNACRQLKEDGYMLALDDFVSRPGLEPLIEMADIIKVDFLLSDSAERRKFAELFLPRGIQLLAEKVETTEDFDEAASLGYQYFQGYFFCKPQVVARKDVPPFKLNYLKFMQEISRPELDFDQLEAAIKREMSLSVKLLRYLNSAAFGWRNEVASIKHGIMLLGEDAMKKWASLVALASMGSDKPPELVVTSLVRGRFCELLGTTANRRDLETELFLVGMLSVIDALVDRPLTEVLEEMNVAPQIADALVSGSNPLGRFLALATIYEKGNWDELPAACAELGITEDRLPETYGNAIEWAEKVFADAAI